MTRLAPESETVEYKSSLSELREGIISMVAMLNKNGRGDVYFGVRDDGEITGLKIGKDTVKSITSTVFDSTDPHVIPELKVLQEDGLEYVKMSAAGENRPYFYKNVVYVRAGD
ncbi:MAG: ATP-binding protein [Candidatus Methanomethylophilaceae archaeon]|nr:ATP-binding protein [Candidatus Methanomethylophilaceae archaeon]